MHDSDIPDRELHKDNPPLPTNENQDNPTPDDDAANFADVRTPGVASMADSSLNSRQERQLALALGRNERSSSTAQIRTIALRIDGMTGQMVQSG